MNLRWRPKADSFGHNDIWWHTFTYFRAIRIECLFWNASFASKTSKAGSWVLVNAIYLKKFTIVVYLRSETDCLTYYFRKKLLAWMIMMQGLLWTHIITTEFRYQIYVLDIICNFLLQNCTLICLLTFSAIYRVFLFFFLYWDFLLLFLLCSVPADKTTWPWWRSFTSLF